MNKSHETGGIGRRTMLQYTGALLGAAMLPNSLPVFAQAATPSATQAQAAPTTSGKTSAVGFVLSTEQFPVNQLVDYGAAADAAGFDMVWSSDHFHPWQTNEGHAGQAWIMLAALGQRSKLGIGTGVTCPTFRYRPAVVAEAFASLGVMYPGRVFLGLGTGEALNEVPAGGGWGRYPERAARLIEAVQIIRGLWSGQTVNFQGKYYQVANARLFDLPTQPVPIFIAANGPKSMALSGQYGDGLITTPTLALDPKQRAIWSAAAKSANKDSNLMPILVEDFVFVGERTDPELQRAAELWRFTPKAWTNYVFNPDPASINKKADMEVPLEEVYNTWTVSGDPQDHIKKIQSLFDAGVTHIFIHSAQADQQKVIDFYGKQVLPLVRSKTPLKLDVQQPSTRQ